MQLVALALLSVLPGLVIIAGLHDLTTMKIPNWISVGLIAGFLPAALVVGLAPVELASHLGVALVALLVSMALFALNWIGGGDAKLMATACLWMGPAASPTFVLFTAVIGGLFCILLLVARARVPNYSGAGTPRWLTHLLAPKGDIPYGVAIAIGALAAYPSSQLIQLFTAF